MSRARLRWRSEALTAGARDALGTALFHCRDAGQHRQQRRCHCWTALPASASQRTGNLCRSSHSWGQKRESPQERRASPNCTFTNLPVRARGAPEASKRRTVSSKSLLKFRSHQEDHCRQASSWAGPLTEAKHRFPVQARTVIQEGQRPNEELRWPQKTLHCFTVLSKKRGNTDQSATSNVGIFLKMSTELLENHQFHI